MAYVLTSYGEIIDKYTILDIKTEKIVDPTKRESVQKELATLLPIVQVIDLHGENHLIEELKQVNMALWDIEDHIRLKEQAQCFDESFISLARSVYITNDKRAQLKYKINQLTQSPIREEKSYAD